VEQPAPYSSVGFAEGGLVIRVGRETRPVRYEDIAEACEETEKSITLGRMLLVGVFALALKKKTHYLRITFKDDTGGSNNLLFECKEARFIAQKVMQERYKRLKRDQTG